MKLMNLSPSMVPPPNMSIGLPLHLRGLYLLNPYLLSTYYGSGIIGVATINSGWISAREQEQSPKMKTRTLTSKDKAKH